RVFARVALARVCKPQRALSCLTWCHAGHELDQPLAAATDGGKMTEEGGRVPQEDVPNETADASDLVGLIADESRLRTFPAVVLGARATEAVSEAAGLPVRETLRALTRLESGGLVERAKAGWEPRLDRLRRAALARPTVDLVDYGDVADETAA